jgi:hypothetical protein
MKYGDSDKYVHGALMAGIRVEVMDFWNFYPGSTSFYEDTKNSFAPVFQIDDDLAKNPLNAVDVLYQLLIDHEDANYGQYVYEPDEVEQLVRRTGLARQHAAERSELVFRTAMSLCDAGDFVLALNDLADKNISTKEKVIIACLVALPFVTARCTRVADFFDDRGNLLKGKLDNAVAEAAKHLDNAPNSGLLHGAGNAPGIFEIGARAKSTAVVRQQLSNGRLREFVYLPDEGVFAINKHLDYRQRGPRFPGSDGSPHSTIRSTLPKSDSVVGGNIRFQNGKYVTDELSGHYGRNWTDDIRAKFRQFMKDQGFEVEHGAF